jgi:lipopolysaccharide/colanic/teichoic acid biosynthesis glycosyltransferase
MLLSHQFMNMIIIPRNSADNNGESLLRFALTNEPFAGVVLDGLCKHRGIKMDSVLRLSAKRDIGKTFYAVPDEWEIEPFKSRHQNKMPKQSLYNRKTSVIRYKDNITIPSEHLRSTKRKSDLNQWFVVSNGRFVTHINADFLDRVLGGIKADIVAVNAEPGLLDQREKVRLTTEGKVAGFCRTYSDSAEFTFVSARWPHHLFIKTDVLDRVLVDGVLPLSFTALSDICRSKEIILRAVNLGGMVLDLETEDGLLSFLDTTLSDIQDSKFDLRDLNEISGDARLIGKVLLGKNIRIGPKAVIIGPTIIGNDARIEGGVVINSSIIGPGVCVPEKQFVLGRIIRGTQINWERPVRHKSRGNLLQDSHGPFRTWPRISYARCFKRIADFFATAMVLILFAPVLILVALAIKLTSPGPVFYKDRRQGLHGKEFNCLKFRTMIMGADKIQDILRIVSQVDGPQFKITNDPRINTVGWFLRETYIDEIPQFFNVLFGQMSIVGPRPSPKSENTLCPFWRDARLSVRPGITGLWQVYRTRHPMKDFQEWIHYDIEYVRNLSLRMDLSICWKSAMKLLENFIDQF